MKGYRAKLDPGWIYYIRSGERGPIKIGWASDPWRRLDELQTGNPERLHLLAIESGRPPREAARHLEFASDRLRGEWFAPSERLYAVIADVRWMSFADAILTFPERFDPTVAAEYRALADEIVASDVG